MKYKTLKLLKRRKRIRQQMEKTNKWIRYITIFLFCCLFLTISSCENVRHKIGITTKPFSKNDGFENVRQSVGVSTNPFSKNVNEKTKFNYKIIFGKVRPKEDDDD